MVWKLYYENPYALPPVVHCNLFETKEEALQRAFEYYTNPSQGKIGSTDRTRSRGSD